MTAGTSTVMPIRISPTSRYFVDKNNQPFFLLGDTLWHLFRNYPAKDVQSVLRRRKEQGFNAALIMLIGYEEKPQPNLNGDLPFLDNNPGKPNEKYFQHVDEVMRIAAAEDFILFCGVYHKTQGNLYTPENAKASARWISARYKNVPNIIWSMYPEARRGFLPVMRALATGLKEGDSGNHMITVHPDPSPQSSSAFGQEDWIACNMVQAWRDIQLVHPMTLADYSMTPVRPVIMAEGGYEAAEIPAPEWRRECARRKDDSEPPKIRWQGEITPADIRRQAWWSFLAGGSHVYGHDGNHNDPTHWKSWIEAPGALGVSLFKKIAAALPNWQDLIPDQSVMTYGTGQDTRLNAAARSAHGDWVLVYLSSPAPVVVRMDMIKSADRFRAAWINPATAERQTIADHTYGEPREFRPPETWEDALLLLEAKS